MYDRLLDAGDDLAADALREAGRIDREREDLAETVAQAETRLAAWPAAPDVDGVLDFYVDLSAAVTLRLSGAKTVAETNQALRTVLDHATLLFTPGGMLPGEFWLRESGGLPRRVGSLMSVPGGDDRVRFFARGDEAADWRTEPAEDLPTREVDVAAIAGPSPS